MARELHLAQVDTSSHISERLMSSFPIRIKVTISAVATVLVVLFGIMNLRDRADFSVPWDGVFWVESSTGLKAVSVAPESAGARAGIMPGEELEALNGRGVRNLGEYRTLLDELGLNAGVVYQLRNASDGSTREVGLQIEGRSLLEARDGLRILLGFLHLGVGLFVVLRGSRSRRAYHFFFICLAAYVAYSYSAIGTFDRLDTVVFWLSLAAPLMLPALFLHFCFRFPHELTHGPSRIYLLYLPSLGLGLVHLLWSAGRLAGLGLPRDAASLQVLDRLDLFYFSAGFLVGGAVLLKRHAGAGDLTTRQQMKWVAYGTLAGIVPFCLVYVIPILLGVRSSLALEFALIFLVLIPLSFAYAIIHYRLLDVEVIMRRSAAYFIASTLLLSLYLFLVLFVGKALEWIAPQADFVVISVGALTIALLFAPLRNQIQSRLDRFFYKEQFDDRASLLEFARMLSSEMSLGRITRSILERVSKTFRIEKAALLLADPSRPGTYQLTDALGLDLSCAADPLLFTEADLTMPEQPDDLPHVAGTNRLYRACSALVERGIHYTQELSLRGRRIGMIGLGQLSSQGHFSTEDLELLGALSGYAAIALENANLYRSVEIKALELERLKLYTENIIESINVAVLVLDLDGRVSSCNRSFEELYGVRRDDIVFLDIARIFPQDVIDSIHKAAGVRNWKLRGTTNIFKLYLENRRQQSLIVNLALIPLVDAGEQTTGCIVVLDDITMKVRLEDQLLQAEKLSSIGLLAAGIAHEVNTPITGISSYTQMLLKETPREDTRRPILEKIEKQTFRAAEIVNGLLNFARMNGSEFAELDINQLIRESISLLEHQLKQGRVLVESHFDGMLPPVVGNAGRLQQVFLNLFLNSRDAMPSGGQLVVETSMNDTMVLVDIRDTGVGISDEDIKRIYDPFFTTKTTGKGTGLGLAVTYGIIQDHGGRIFVDSTPGKGTHFRIKLPTRRSL